MSAAPFHPGGWPCLNQRVEVRHEAWSAWLPSRIEDVAAGGIVIAAPGTPGLDSLPAGDGDPVSLRWTHDRGLGLLDGRLAVPAPARLALWRVVPQGPPLVVQRRHFARVPVVLPVVAEASGSLWPLTTLDLAEGGMRCVGRRDATWEPADEVELRFDVDGAPVRAGARVSWSGRTLAGSTVAFRFTDLLPGEADRLRRFVFRTQARRVRPG